MHIADGVLPVWISGAGWIATATGVAFSLRKLPVEEVPKISLVTAALFLAGLIHVPLGPTSVHLMLNGLAGLLLGPLAFLSFFIALSLQALLFQFGGLFSLGLNTLVVGGPALMVGILSHKKGLYRNPLLSAVFCGGAVLLSGIFLALALSFAGENFIGVARLAMAAHLPVAVIEGLIGALTLKALKTLKPSFFTPWLILILIPSPSLAHRLDTDVFPEKNTVRVEAFFPDGTPAVGDRVKMLYQDRVIATCTTDSEGVCTLPRPNYPEVKIVVLGKMGHRAERMLKLTPHTPVAQKDSASPERSSTRSQAPRGKFPITEVLAGLGFLFGLSGFVVAWDTRRRLKALASSRN